MIATNPSDASVKQLYGIAFVHIIEHAQLTGSQSILVCSVSSMGTASMDDTLLYGTMYSVLGCVEQSMVQVRLGEAVILHDVSLPFSLTCLARKYIPVNPELAGASCDKAFLNVMAPSSDDEGAIVCCEGFPVSSISGLCPSDVRCTPVLMLDVRWPLTYLSLVGFITASGSPIALS